MEVDLKVPSGDIALLQLLPELEEVPHGMHAAWTCGAYTCIVTSEAVINERLEAGR